MFVRDWMTPDPVTVGHADPVGKARQLLVIHKVRRMPIVKGTHLAGIVTDRDLRLGSDGHAPPDDAPVHSVGTPKVVTITPGDTIEHAAAEMVAHRVGGLPVLEKGELVGIITETDVFRALVEMLGFRDGGARLVLTLGAGSPSLATQLQALEARGLALTSVVTYRRRAGGETHAVVRTSARGSGRQTGRKTRA